MRKLLARILCSAACEMWQQDPNLGVFTRETFQHELNLQFHFANALRKWFPWLDCDFNVSKAFLNREQPDIVFHKRGITTLNFLAIEVKRKKHRRAVSADVKQITSRWFGNRLHYRFGAVVILEDDKPEYEVRIFERCARGRPTTKTHANMDVIARPEADCDHLLAVVNQISRKEKDDVGGPIQESLSQLDTLVKARFRIAV